MKKIILFLFLTGVIQALNAQTFRGDWFIDCCFGGLKYSSTSKESSFSNSTTVENSDRSSFGIKFNPRAAWFVRDNLAIGGGVSLGYSSKNNETTNTTNSTFKRTMESTQPSFYLGPIARYYFCGNERAKPFGQFDFQFGMTGGKEKEQTTFSSITSSETTATSKNNWRTGLSLGYEYFVTPNVGIYGSLGINYEKGKTIYEYKPDTGTSSTETEYYTRFYIPVNVGIQVHILGNKDKSKS